MKVVIIGGVAAGAKAAAKTRRLMPDFEIDIYTEDTHVSYSSCGLPYYIEGNFDDYKKLLIRSPEEFEKSKIFVHLKQKVLKIMPDVQKILIKNLDNNKEYFVYYDKLVLAVGAKPVIPNIKNVHLENIFTLRTIEDGIKIREAFINSEHITIVGGGYIGIELLEAAVKNKKHVTLVESNSHIMKSLDCDIAKIITEHIQNEYSNYVRLLTNTAVLGFSGTKKVEKVLISTEEKFLTDMVILCVGIAPVTDIAVDAGINLGETGAIKVNSRMETNIQNIYACGDCVEEINIITQQPVWLPLGTNANKEGRCAAINLSGYTEDFQGVLCAMVTRFMGMTISKIGLTHNDAVKYGFDPVSVIVTKKDRAGYMPEVKNITIKLVADKRTHRILGAQGIGTGDVDKRINTLSVGLLEEIRVEELFGADMTYAPPYSSAIDPLLSAAGILIEKLK